VKRLEAVCFWSRSKGMLPADVDWKFDVPIGIDFKQTAMLTVEPISGGWPPSFRVQAQALEAAGLPVRPYLGSSAVEVADFLVSVLRRAVDTANKLSERQAAWKIAFETEYDFQNLFFATAKPWLPGLGREEIAVWYDGQEKACGLQPFRQPNHYRVEAYSRRRNKGCRG
jgi:hypothetical protein